MLKCFQWTKGVVWPMRIKQKVWTLSAFVGFCQVTPNTRHIDKYGCLFSDCFGGNVLVDQRVSKQPKHLYFKACSWFLDTHGSRRYWQEQVLGKCGSNWWNLPEESSNPGTWWIRTKISRRKLHFFDYRPSRRLPWSIESKRQSSSDFCQPDQTGRWSLKSLGSFNTILVID